MLHYCTTGSWSFQGTGKSLSLVLDPPVTHQTPLDVSNPVVTQITPVGLNESQNQMGSHDPGKVTGRDENGTLIGLGRE